jgi:hypothetical protein
MPYILKNKNLEIHIDLPSENYNASRFDWTGKIVNVKFQNVQLSSMESHNPQNEHQQGKGFYNEFGMDTALGFDESVIGGWFHKIGVGLLKKTDSKYHCGKNYEIDPAKFKISTESNTFIISCHSKTINGYSYVLKKEIVLQENNFTINYSLKNTGEKDIITDEYVHNFTLINKELIGCNYVLKFPFQLKPLRFIETVNPEKKVEIGQNAIKFNQSPKETFFFSNLSGSKNVDAQWELITRTSTIGISETGNFQTNKVNLWGGQHVISPELFFNIAIQPGQSTQWSRSYNVYKVI